MSADNNQSLLKKFFNFISYVFAFTQKDEYQKSKSSVVEIQSIINILGFFLFLILGGVFYVVSTVKTPEKVQQYLIYGNIIALSVWIIVIFLPKIKHHELKFKDDLCKEQYGRLLKIKEGINVEEFNKRVNRLVRQFKVHITLYAICLLIVYIAFLFDNGCLWQPCDGVTRLVETSSNQHLYLKIFEDSFNLFSAAFLYLGFKVLYNRTLNSKHERNKYYIDALVVCVAFQLLYLPFMHSKITAPSNSNLPNQTMIKIGNIANNYTGNSNNAAAVSLNEIKQRLPVSENSNVSVNKIREIKQITDDYKENKTNTKIKQTAGNSDTNANNADNEPAILLEKIKNKLSDSENSNVSANLMEDIRTIADNHNANINQKAMDDVKEAINEYEQVNSSRNSNIFGLIVGSFNGLAMSLLFGRYLSMQHVIYNTKENTFFNLFSICTVFLLPIYALAQPLFGAFEINAFGNPKVFANGVFFVCLMGKLFFLYFTYKFIKERYLHYYLHLIATSHDILKNIGDFFEDKYTNPNPEKSADKENEET